VAGQDSAPGAETVEEAEEEGPEGLRSQALEAGDLVGEGLGELGGGSVEAIGVEADRGRAGAQQAAAFGFAEVEEVAWLAVPQGLSALGACLLCLQVFVRVFCVLAGRATEIEVPETFEGGG